MSRLTSAFNRLARGHRPHPPPGEAPQHGRISVEPVRAYVNHGRWVADCVRPYCGGAEALRPGQSVVQCFNCQLVAPVEWPRDAAEIWEALAERPVPQTRNWFPKDHPLAVRHGCPHGQTVAALRAETAEHTHDLTSAPTTEQIEGGAQWRGPLH